MKRIALFFGSFNPIHIGHLAIANYVVEFCDFAELWMIVSPQNPLKDKNILADETHRFAMARLAVETLDLPIKICDIETRLPKPSYTINTLEALSATYADCNFAVIMGADSIANIERWYKYKNILDNYEICVYPRLGFDTKKICEKYGVTYVEAPIVEISSTFVRQSISEGKNVNAFMPLSVADYVRKNKLYKTNLIDN